MRGLINAVLMTGRRHFYGHWFQRRARQWTARHATTLVPAFDKFFTFFLPIQTAVAYPVLSVWLWISGQFQRRRVRINESRINALCQTHDDVHLVPATRRYSRGDVSQYYHFMYSVVLPLSRIIQSTPEHVRFTLPTINGVGPLLTTLWPERVRYVDETPDSASATLYGMSPREVALNADDLENFAKTLARAVDAKTTHPRDTVVLIDRPLPPGGAQDGYSGGLRRRVRNHDALAARIAKSTHPSLRFVNVSLENMTLAEQIELFSRAVLIVAQHGAALGNLVWASTGTDVVEIYSNYYFDFFRRISKLKKLRHHLWPVTSGHPTIDVDAFVTFLSQIDFSNSSVPPIVNTESTTPSATAPDAEFIARP